jgi:hypothetical protein
MRVLKGRITPGARILGILFLVGMYAGGCSDNPGGPSPADPLRGGIVATFAVGEEGFRVWIRNPGAIAEVLALQRGASSNTIPNSVLRTGDGQGDHNAPYSWHLDPDAIEMAGATIELCDGRPSFVEANRDQFIREVGRYCPWGARLVSVEDYR